MPTPQARVGLGKPTSGWLQRNGSDLASGIAAFFADLGPLADRVTLVTVSVFGRRVQANGTGGLDHGWGNVMLAAGAGVRGGRYYGRWPGLQNSERRHGVPGLRPRDPGVQDRPVTQMG